MRPEVAEFYSTSFGGIAGFKKKLDSKNVERAAEMVFDRNRIQPYPNDLVIGQQTIAITRALDRDPGYKMSIQPLSAFKRFFYTINPVWSV